MSAPLEDAVRPGGSGPGGARAGSGARAWLAAAVGLALAFVLVLLATRPAWDASPLFTRHRPSAGAPWLPVRHDRPLVLSFALRDAPPEALRLAVRVPAGGEPLEVSAWSEPDETPLGSLAVRESGLARLALLPAAGERLRVELRSLAESDEVAPRVGAAELPPLLDAELRDPAPGEEARAPLLHLGRGERHGLWLLVWLVPLGLQLLVPRRRAACLAALALACALTSLLLWERFRSVNVAAGDPDGYGRAAQVLAGLLRGELGWEDVRAHFHRYPHAHTALVSWWLAPWIAAGVPMQVAYLATNALLGLGTLALFERLLARGLLLEGRARVLGVWALAAHLIVLRSFARPTPDALGLCLSVASLVLVLERLRGPAPRDRAWLALLSLAHVLARPQGPALAVFTVAGFALADLLREGRAGARRELGRTLLAGAAPLVLLAPLYLSFGWGHNVVLSLRKAARYRSYWTPDWLGVSLLATLQLLPVAWVLGGSRVGAGRASRAPALLALATLAYALLVVLVRAPLWPRHFLPAVPGAVGLAAVAAAGDDRRARAAGAVLVLTIAADLLVVGWQIVRFLPWLYLHQEQRLPEVLYRMLFE